MSNYPWSGTNANPYTGQNPYDYVGVQGFGDTFTNSTYPPRPVKADADIVASSVSGLYTALGNVSAGQMIWVDAGTYDVTGRPQRRQLPTNATLAGGGARIIAPGGINGFLELVNSGSRVTGLRFEGDQTDGAYTQQTIAILARANCRIDNCEFYNWQTSPIYVGWPTDSPEALVEPRINHCVIRDNRTTTFGYGVLVASGDPYIEYNHINNNRYGIIGTGGAESSFRAYNNLHGSDSIDSQIEQKTPGGKRMDVRYNELRVVTESDAGVGRAYAQRGTPGVLTNYYNNWAYNPTPPNTSDSADNDAAVVQTGHGSTGFTNVSFGNNHYGSASPSSSTTGIQPLAYEGTTSTQWPGTDPPTGTEQGDDITLPGDSATLQVSQRQGLVIRPSTDLAGVRARISSQVSGYTTAYLATLTGSILTSKNVSSVPNGSYFDILAPAKLASGTSYLLQLDAGGGSYIRGATAASYPYSTSHFSIPNGVYSNGGTLTTVNRYNIDAVQALLPAQVVEPPPDTDLPPSETPVDVTIVAQDEHGRPVEGAAIRIYEDA